MQFTCIATRAGGRGEPGFVGGLSRRRQDAGLIASAGSRPAAASNEAWTVSESSWRWNPSPRTSSRRTATSSRRAKTRRFIRSTAASPSDSTVSRRSTRLPQEERRRSPSCARCRVRFPSTSSCSSDTCSGARRSCRCRHRPISSSWRRQGPVPDAVLAALLSLLRRPGRQLRAGHLAPSVARHRRRIRLPGHRSRRLARRGRLRRARVEAARASGFRPARPRDRHANIGPMTLSNDDPASDSAAASTRTASGATTAGPRA